jgi:hypothetical protein
VTRDDQHGCFSVGCHRQTTWILLWTWWAWYVVVFVHLHALVRTCTIRTCVARLRQRVQAKTVINTCGIHMYVHVLEYVHVSVPPGTGGRTRCTYTVYVQDPSTSVRTCVRTRVEHVRTYYQWKSAHMRTRVVGSIQGSQLREVANAGQHTPNSRYRRHTTAYTCTHVHVREPQMIGQPVHRYLHVANSVASRGATLCASTTTTRAYHDVHATPSHSNACRAAAGGGSMAEV